MENVRKTIGELGSKAIARTYVMHAKEDMKVPDVITSNFSLFDINIHALIDSGLTHSYIVIS